MGFGLLFSGYATLLLFRIIPIEIVGFFVMYLAIDKLEKHEKKFTPAKFVAVYLFFEAVFYTAVWAGSYIDMPSFFSADIVRNIENVLYQTGLFAFHIFLLRALASVCNSVGYEKGMRRARVSLVATVIFYIAELCALLIPGAARYMLSPLAIYQLLWLCFNIFTLYGCYMMIVTDEMLEKEEEKYAQFMEKYGKKKKQLPEKQANAGKNTGKKFRATSTKK